MDWVLYALDKKFEAWASRSSVIMMKA